MKGLKKILFVTYGGGHARMLKPVIENLLNVHGIEVEVLALNTGYFELQNIKARLWRYKDFFSLDEEAQRLGRRCVESLEKVVDVDESISYLGANMKELVTTLGEEEAFRRYERGGRYIFEPRNTMRTIVERISPDVLVATNSPRSEKMAVEAAAELGIPSVAFIDMFGIRCESWFCNSDFADKVLVLSESVRQHYIELGRDSADLIVTGNPSFDLLVTRYADEREQIELQRLRSPYTVLWASQPEPAYLAELDLYGDTEFPYKAEAELLKVFEAHPDWRLIARNHPSEHPRSYPAHVKVSNQADSIPELLSAVDVVLTPSSTIGFQGVIMGTGLITIDCSVLTPTMPYSSMGYSEGISRFSEIGHALEKHSHPSAWNLEPRYQERNATGKAACEILSLL